MDAHAEVNRLLKSSGARLIRQHRHEVWLLPDGKTFIRAKTPSSRNEANVDLATLRRLVGIQQGKGEGERRDKRIKGKVAPVRERFEPQMNTGLADKLRLAGVSESAVRVELEETQAELSRALRDLDYAGWEIGIAYAEIQEAQAEIRTLKARICTCLGCELTRWGRRIWRRLLLLPTE